MARIAPLNIDWKPDRTTGEPVTEQIVGYMCEQVHSGNWPIGSRLPSQRALAEWFGVNRSTVIAAINELSDYGIVEGQHGAGTRIVSNTWSLMLPGAPDWADYVDSGFFKANNDTIQAINRYEFTPNMTRIGTGELDPRLFPKAMWRQVLGEAADEIETLGYPPPEGLPELREAIAAHMRATGVDCTASQVLVTSCIWKACRWTTTASTCRHCAACWRKGSLTPAVRRRSTRATAKAMRSCTRFRPITIRQASP